MGLSPRYLKYRDYSKWYYQQYRTRNIKKSKTYKQTHKEEMRVYRKEYDENRYLRYRKNIPWYFYGKSAKQRCNNPNRKDFESYGGRGIKFLMTNLDLQYLWLRDCATKLKQPSLDRIDNNKSYTRKNCRFIEFTENSKKRR